MLGKGMYELQKKDFILMEKRITKYRMLLNIMFILNIIILVNIIHMLIIRL